MTGLPDAQRGHYERGAAVTEKDREAAREALTFGYRQERVAAAIATARAEALAPFEELFSGGTDTACRTTWRDEDVWNGIARTECVEVPLDDLRDAFDAAIGSTP